MTALAMMIAAIALTSVPASDDLDPMGFSTIEDAVVVSLSPRPTIDSGIVAVWAHIDVEAGGSDRQRMFLLYGGPDQFIPPVNSMCRVVFARARISGVGFDKNLYGRKLLNRVEEITCDTGRWHTF